MAGAWRRCARREPRVLTASQERHPNALQRWADIEAAAAGKAVVVFSDYDGARRRRVARRALPGAAPLTRPRAGTLTPIVDHPERAFMSGEMRASLEAVASLFPVGIVSGRGLAKVTAFVGLPQLYYAASHGLDIRGPEGAGDAGALVHQPVPWAKPLMDAVHDALVERVAPISGASVEHNCFCVSVHYRRCPERWPEVGAAVEAVLAEQATPDRSLRCTRGRKVYEVRPHVAWDKGKALLFLLSQLEGAEEARRRGGLLVIYLGDDVSDEDAFGELDGDPPLGIGVLVTSRPKPTRAKYSLEDTTQVNEFLDKLVALGRARLQAGDG